MPARPRALVIDARPRGPRGPLAGEIVLGRSVLAHLVEIAVSIETGSIVVHARVDEHEPLRRLVSHDVIFRTGPPPENAAILRADRLYDSQRLRRVLRSGKDTESAVIWRLDRPNGLEAASATLIRRESYQPLGRFWALTPATRLAERLSLTRVRPNAVTLAAAALMLASACAVAFGPVGWIWRIVIALMLALALVLDTADGHLARLQGTASEFGRWLDALLDEFADLALHAAVAWSMFTRSGKPAWMALGMSYAIGKYLFVVAQQSPGQVGGNAKPALVSPSLFKTMIRLIGHADIRWHLWIVLALVGRLEWALIAYCVYFPVRVAGIALRKAVRDAR